ncbi:MAG: 2-hydroxyacyl-CoA dehydratase subunit D [Christensenellales bacterium]|jgi:benzoyl-CoA reductase/2-hydroxyglutaryl-CoA dehydratase subunit BcrC/BadD/HgdB
MSSIIDKFGRIVEGNIKKNPKRALFLLRAAYYASGLQSKYLPDRRLLPHQRFAAVVNNKTIRTPLVSPRESAVINMFLPCEMLHAMGVIPQFVEGFSCYLNGAACERMFISYAENSGVPQTYCSYHKILLGAALSGVLPKPRFIANTTLACDANAGTFRTLANHWKIPRFTIDVPKTQTGETITYVATQLRQMRSFIEDVMRRKLDEQKLKLVIRSENRSMCLYREYFKELPKKYLPNDLSSEMLKIFLTHVLLGTDESERYFELLLSDVRNAAKSKNEKRILWVHTIPYWQNSINQYFDFNPKYQLLCCDLNFDSIAELDEDRPYESMALKLLENTMCGTGKKRALKVLQTAQSLRAHGVIYFCHWGCKQTLGNAYLTKDMFEKSGMPLLVLDGDGCDRKNINDGQMETRLQAFLELLETAI